MLASALLLSGCYEGWDYDRKGDGKTGPQQPTPTPPSIPPFFYILLEPVYLSSAAIDDGRCFEQGLEEFRKAEWAERVRALSAALTPLTANFVLVEHAIAKDDCTSLTALSRAAISTKPWAPNPDPEDDPLDRSLVNVRAVFWEGDVEKSPPAEVTEPQWSAFAKMATSGRKAKTVNHFVMERAAEGYFHTWLSEIAATQRVDGTPINDVDPSDAGIARRTATVNADAAAVAQWLTEHP